MTNHNLQQDKIDVYLHCHGWDIKSLHQTFSIQHAIKFGVNEAIMISFLQKFVERNKILKTNFFLGKTWVRLSLCDFSKLIPFWTSNKINSILEHLKKKDVISVTVFNENKIDRTRWFAFQNENDFFVGAK